MKPQEEWVVTACPAVVSEDLWDQCNAILDEQEKKRKVITRRGINLFTSILYCDCGSKMYIPSNSKKYVCLTCRKRRIEMGDLEEIYYENLKEYLLSEEQIKKFKAQSVGKIQDKETELALLKKEALKVEGEMNNLISLFQANEIPKVGFSKFFNPLQDRLDQITQYLPELEAEIDFLKIQSLNSDHVIDEAEDLYNSWPKLSHQDKRDIIETITQKITIGNEDITFKFHYSPTAPFKIQTSTQRNAKDSWAPCFLTDFEINHSLLRWNKISKKPVTVGDHIRLVRIGRQLFQKDVARILGVCQDTITGWESGRTKPLNQIYPAIINFLGYNPFN